MHAAAGAWVGANSRRQRSLCALLRGGGSRLLAAGSPTYSSRLCVKYVAEEHEQTDKRLNDGHL